MIFDNTKNEKTAVFSAICQKQYDVEWEWFIFYITSTKKIWNLVFYKCCFLNLLHSYRLCLLKASAVLYCSLLWTDYITFRFVSENVKHIYGNGGSKMPEASRRILLKQPSRRKMLYFLKFHIDQTHTLFAVKFLHLISSYESISWATVHKHGSEWIIERT